MFRRAVINSRNILMPRVASVRRQPHRHFEENDRTIVKILNMEINDGLMIDSFSQVGFRLNNNMTVVGPIAIFPKTVLSWRVTSHADINEDSLSLFYLLDPRIDLLIIGVGDKGNKLDMKIVQFMKNKGINVEIMPTESACTTFNFLNEERRYVAGAFIPPYSLTITEDEVMETERRRKRLHMSTDDW